MKIVGAFFILGQAFWLLHLFFSPVSSQSQGSANCTLGTSASSCILPDPQPSLEAGNLNNLWLEMRCMLGCIEKVRVVWSTCPAYLKSIL